MSNIIKDLVLSSGEDHAVSKAISKLKELKEDGDDEEIFKELEILKVFFVINGKIQKLNFLV